MTEVLLCTADEQLGIVARQAFHLEQVRTVSHASTSEAVLEHLARTGADIAVVDDRLGPVPAWDLIRQITVRHPHVGIVVVVDESGPGTLVTAMEVGVRGLLHRPLSVDETRSRVRAAAAWSAAVRRTMEASAVADGPAGTMVTLAGSKGGVGVSTLAVHLALQVLADDPTRTVCLVDLDLSKGDLPTLLDIQHRRDITDLVQVADELSARSLSEVLFDHATGVKVLLAPGQAEDAEEITEHVARKVLDALRSLHDVVIIDAGANPTEANTIAAELSDAVYVVTTPDVPALRGVRRLTGLWERLSVRKEDQTQVVLNRVNRRSDIQPDTARRIVGLPVLGAVVPAGFRWLESSANRRNPRTADPRFVQAVRQLGAAIGLVRNTAPVSARRSRQRHDGGQASLEFVGLSLIILVTAALVWQAVLIGATWTLAGNAAGEAARAVSVGQDPEAAALAAVPDAWQDGMQVSATGPGTVTVRVRTPLLFPGVRGLPLDVTSSAGAVPEVEP
ncbi:MAG: P-loop NTPase, partial [Kineosporiaceae bacterium]